MSSFLSCLWVVDDNQSAPKAQQARSARGGNVERKGRLVDMNKM